MQCQLTEEKIIRTLKKAKAGMKTTDLCRTNGISDSLPGHAEMMSE